MVMMTKENPAKEGSTLNSETTLISNQWNFCKKKDYKDKLWYDFALIINQWNFYKKNYDKDRLWCDFALISNQWNEKNYDKDK